MKETKLTKIKISKEYIKTFLNLEFKRSPAKYDSKLKGYKAKVSNQKYEKRKKSMEKG